MSSEQVQGRVEPVVECPYCQEPIFRRSLYGHVSAADDKEHGVRGTVPDDYDEQSPNIIEYTQIRSRPHAEPDERILCGYCFRTFNGEHGIDVHLGMKRGDGQHPEDATVEDASIPLSVYREEEEKRSPPPRAAQADLSDYRNKLKSMTQSPSEAQQPAATTVPADALLDLLDDYREREADGAAYVTCAKMLQDVLEEHNVL